jgi:hypothetical protein
MQRQCTAWASLGEYDSDATDKSPEDEAASKASPKNAGPGDGADAGIPKSEVEPVENAMKVVAEEEDKEAAEEMASTLAAVDAADTFTSIENGEFTDLAYTKETGKLRARCSVLVGNETLFFDVNWDIGIVPGKGSCCPIAILSAIAGLDLKALSEEPSLQDVKWEAVRRWANFGKDQDPDCTAFRRHVFAFLFKNSQLCQGYFDNDIRIGKDRDVTERNLKQALLIANKYAVEQLQLVIDKNLMDRVQWWSVAILHPKVQFTEEIVRALLAVELGDMIGVLVAIRTFVPGPGVDNGKLMHRLFRWQPWVPEKAKLLIATVQNSAQEHFDDKVPGAAGKALRSGAVVKSVAKAESFWAVHNDHHFNAVSICNGVGGGLIVSQLVEQEAKKAKYDKWLPSDCPNIGMASPSTSLEVRRLIARSNYRRHAGKDSEGPSSDEDAPVGAPQGGPGTVEAATTSGGEQGRVVDLSSLPDSPAVINNGTPAAQDVRRRLETGPTPETNRRSSASRALANLRVDAASHAAGAAPLRSVDMHRCRLTVVHTRHYEAYASRLELHPALPRNDFAPVHSCA